jgi:putative peptidoglycan lipid II flippase
MGPLSTVGLALASSVAIIAQAWYLQTHLARRHHEFAFQHLLPTVMKVCAAAVVMGLLVVAGRKGLGYVAGRGVWSDLLALGGLIPLGAVAYGAVLWKMNVEGIDEVQALLRQWRAKSRG